VARPWIEQRMIDQRRRSGVGPKQRREQPVEPDEDQPICIAQPRSGWRGPLQCKQLLAEKSHLGFASHLRSEQSNDDPPSNFKRSIIPAQG
jgi:hypothetical protein